MKKAKFKSKRFYNLLRVLLGSLFFWNIYATINTQNLLGIFSIIITGVLFFMVHSKHRYIKSIIIYWTGFLVATAGIVFLAHIVKHLAGGTLDEMDYMKLGLKLLDIAIFLSVYRAAENYISIVDEVEKQEPENLHNDLEIEDHLISNED